MTAWKFQQIEPQPARGTFREELWEDPDWIAEEKYDGDRRIAQFCGKLVRFTGRRKSVKDGLFVEKTANVPHLSGWFDKQSGGERLPDSSPPKYLEGTVLDGEMVFTGLPDDSGGRSKYVTSIMGSLPEEAIRKQFERGWLKYVVFDCLFYKGEDIRGFSLMARRLRASLAVREWGNSFVSLGEWSASLGEWSAFKKSFCAEIIARGGEGVILKHLDHKYGDKTGWVKVKKTLTADVVITGFEAAKKESKKRSGEVSETKYAKAGLIGAVTCGQFVSGVDECCGSMQRSSRLEEVATVSGMDDALRADITAHPKKYLGKVLRLKHNGREPTGRFRHPRWDGLRSDKSPEQCIFNLEES